MKLSSLTWPYQLGQYQPKIVVVKNKQLSIGLLYPVLVEITQESDSKSLQHLVLTTI